MTQQHVGNTKTHLLASADEAETLGQKLMTAAAKARESECEHVSEILHQATFDGPWELIISVTHHDNEE